MDHPSSPVAEHKRSSETIHSRLDVIDDSPMLSVPMSYNLPSFNPSGSTTSLLEAVVGPVSPDQVAHSVPEDGSDLQRMYRGGNKHPYRNASRPLSLSSPPSSFPTALATYSHDQGPSMERKPSIATSSSSASSISRFSRLSRSEAVPVQSPINLPQEDSDEKSKADSSEWDILSDAGARLNEDYVGEEEAQRYQELEKKVERRRSKLPQLTSQLAALEARIKEAEARLAKAQGDGKPIATSAPI